MPDFTPAQVRAIESLGTNVAVSAGAGAGKTRVLVERYLHILRQGRAKCDEILAVTFTNKAAKEMKERIRAKAVELAEGAATEEERRLWREVKGQMEYAAIGTFHSFCARVLRDNPVEAALDPQFKVLDETAASLLLEKAIDETFETGLADNAEWLGRLLTNYDKAQLTFVLPGIYEKLSARGMLTADLAERLTRPYRQAVAEVGKNRGELSEKCQELIALKNELDEKSANFVRLERLERNWGEISAAIKAAGGENENALTVLHSYLDGLDRRSKGKEIIAAVKETLSSLDQAQADRLALTMIPDLCRLLLAIHSVMGSYKREHRVLTFADLEVRTVDILKNAAGVRQKYCQKIRQIMVDEFQDSNELQRQIIFLLAGGDAEKLYGNKLFVVGDAKQSIYRFRGADVGVFEQARREISAGGGELIELDVNFRSMDDLIALYNECFGALMGTAGDEIAFAPLRSHRRGKGPAPGAELLVVAKDKAEEWRSVRETEAAAVARRIRAMVGGGERLINRDAEPRAVQYGDIAILFRTAKDIDTYAAALQDYGIPYYIVGGRGFYGCQEIVDVLNLLKVIDNHLQETALAGVLRSPMFLLADETLVRLKEAGYSLWQGLERHMAIPELTETERLVVARAWQVLKKLYDLRGMIGTAELIRLALKETGYANLVLTQFMGQQKYANLTKLVRLADDYEQQGMFTLGDFLRYVDKLVDGDIQEGEAQLESEGGDTVKFMTIHKAKGLEFPVVFLPDLHRKFKDEIAAVLFNSELGIGLKVPGAGGGLTASSVYRRIAAEEKRLAQMELKRLLYVAFTRAKDYLVLSAEANKVVSDKELSRLNTWLEWLGWIYGFSAIADLPDSLNGGKIQVVLRDTREEKTPRINRGGWPKSTEAQPEWLNRIERNIAPVSTDTNGNRTFSASHILKFRQCPRAFYYLFHSGLPEVADYAANVAGDVPPGRLTGSVLHRCLELLMPGMLWQDCLSRAAEEIVPLRWRGAVIADAAPLLKRYVNSAFYREKSSLPCRKEWQFQFNLPGSAAGGYWFTGRIDCLVAYSDGSYGIVDYKTDKVDDAVVAAKADVYKPQLVLYAAAVQAALGKSVKDAQLYFLRHDRVMAIPVDQAAEAAVFNEIRRICQYALEHESEAAYSCNADWCRRCGYGSICSHT